MYTDTRAVAQTLCVFNPTGSKYILLNIQKVCLIIVIIIIRRVPCGVPISKTYLDAAVADFWIPTIPEISHRRPPHNAIFYIIILFKSPVVFLCIYIYILTREIRYETCSRYILLQHTFPSRVTTTSGMTYRRIVSNLFFSFFLL